MKVEIEKDPVFDSTWKRHCKKHDVQYLFFKTCSKCKVEAVPDRITRYLRTALMTDE